MKRIVNLLLISLLSCQGYSQTLSGSPDTMIRNRIKSFGIVGFSAAILSDKGILWSNGYGYADREKQIPYTPNTIMNIGSISKSITGICIMRAVQDGKVSLDEDINRYLPFPVRSPLFPNDKITLRQLVAHTSGIRDQDPAYGDSAYHYHGDAVEPLGHYLKDYLTAKGRFFSAANFTAARPGTESEYSNIGAGLAGFVVECATGRKLNAYSREFLFRPLDLTSTGWFLYEIDTSRHSRLYKRKDGTLTNVPWYGLVTYPDGGIRTTVTELSKILLCMASEGKGNGKQILKPEIAEILWRPIFTTSNKPGNYDIVNYNEAVFWSMTDSTHKIGHVGRDPGIETYMAYDRKLKRGLIVFYNTGIPYADREKFNLIYEDLWNFARSLKDKQE